MGRVADVAILAVALIAVGVVIASSAPVELRASLGATAVGLLLYLSRRRPR